MTSPVLQAFCFFDTQIVQARLSKIVVQLSINSTYQSRVWKPIPRSSIHRSHGSPLPPTRALYAADKYNQRRGWFRSNWSVSELVGSNGRTSRYHHCGCRDSIACNVCYESVGGTTDRILYNIMYALAGYDGSVAEIARGKAYPPRERGGASRCSSHIELC
jgi:hypothetical protein